MKAVPAAIPVSILAAYAALILTRMFLVSHDEILPWGADGAEYVAASIHDLWYGQERGGVSLMASVARHLGLPYKLALDAAYVAICLWAARRLVRATASEPLGLIAFFMLAFSSYFFRASLIFLSDPPAACLIFAAVLVYSRFVDRPVSRWRWRDVLAGSIILALWALTRREELIIYGSMVLLALTVFLLQWRRWHEGWNPRALVLIVPLVLMLGCGEAVRLRNIEVHQVSAQSRYSGSGQGALMSALYSIPPDRELRFCPVTNRTFEAAAEVSPTLRPLLPKLLDPQNLFRRYAADKYHIPGEVCTWLNYLLPDAYASAYSVNDGTADAAMARTAREIREAQKSGRLGRRFGSYPIDPLWRLWLPELPRAFVWGAWTSLGLHYDVAVEAETSRQTVAMPLAMERDYGEALLQRESLLKQDQLDVSGILKGEKPADAANTVLLRESGAVIGASPVYPFLEFMHVARFDITTHPLKPGDALLLEFSKGAQTVKLAPLPFSGTTTIQLGDGEETWDVVIRRGGAQPALSRRLEMAVINVNGLILAFGSLCCCAIAFVRSRNEALDHPFELAALALTALCFTVPRTGFYALLDVWLRWDSSRYFSASSGAALLAVIAAVAFAGSWLGARGRHPTLRRNGGAIS